MYTCVAGEPVPQPRARVSARGGFARAYVPAKHPVHAYRKSISDAWSADMATWGIGAFPGSVRVIIEAVFSRPKSHRTKKGIRSSAPPRPRADVDNVAKAVLDSLTGCAWEDDAQVVHLSVSKRWTEAEFGWTMITIEEVE